MNENILLERLRKGDTSALHEIMQLWQDQVYNTALGIVQNTEEAEEITQDVFVQVYRGIRAFRGESKFSTWLYRITVSKAITAERKKKTRKRFALFQGWLGKTEEEAESVADFYHPGVQLEQKENAAILFRALKKLPEQQRIAFTLQKLEGLSSAEIGSIMNITPAAVDSLLQRGRAGLRKLLETYYQHQKKLSS